MTCTQGVVLLSAGLALAGSPAKAGAEVTSNPLYHGIVRANIFALKPPLATTTSVPSEPLPSLRLAGVTTLGQKRALVNKRCPAKPPEPAKELSYLLAEGQRHGPLTVLDIDAQTGRVKVDVSGTVLVLSLDTWP